MEHRNKPLTLKQLREMDGQPAYWPEDKSWGIISVETTGRLLGIPFFRGRKDGSNFEYDIESRGMEVYAYQPAHIDLESWESEWKRECFYSECKNCGYYSTVESHFCPHYGKAMDQHALNIIKHRIGG